MYCDIILGMIYGGSRGYQRLGERQRSHCIVKVNNVGEEGMLSRDDTVGVKGNCG